MEENLSIKNKYEILTEDQGLVRIYFKGKEFFEDALEDLKSAKREILMEFYIFLNDSTGEKFAQILHNKAISGVEVYLIIDAMGCLNVPESFFERLKFAGVKIYEYNPVAIWRKRARRQFSPLHRRDHRKLIVIDGKITYFGGINIGEKFNDWEDLQFRVEGGLALEARKSFFRVWNREFRKFIMTWFQPIREKKASINLLESFPKDDYSPVKKHYITAFKHSKKHIFIANAYFYPDRKIRKVLKKAVKRGVDVKIMVPHKSDIKTVDLASRYLYNKLLKSKIQIYRYYESMLHSKYAIIDEDLMLAGSANLDRISLFKCLELFAIINNKEIISLVKNRFIENLKYCYQIDLKTWQKRPLKQKILEWGAYRLRKLFDEYT